MNYKQRILTFLPVMKELEVMGHNPVEVMFGEPAFPVIEDVYVAITRAKEKYPNWYKVVSNHISKLRR